MIGPRSESTGSRFLSTSSTGLIGASTCWIWPTIGPMKSDMNDPRSRRT